MGKSLFNGAITCVVAFLTLVTVSSCVEEEFELSKDRLDLNVTVFQEGISIPLGSTDKIVLDSLYKQLDSATMAMLKKVNGAFMFSMADTLDVTKDITSALEGIGALDSVALTKNFSFPLENIDLSAIKIKGQPLTMEPINIEEMLAELDLEKLNEKLPAIGQAMDPITVAVPKVEADDLSMDFVTEKAKEFQKQTPIASLASALPSIPEDFLNHDLAKTEMDYEQIRSWLSTANIHLPELQTSFDFEEYQVQIPVTLSLPSEIKSVKEIQLHEHASFELVCQIINPLFTSGSIVPEIDVDLHELLHIDDESAANDGAIEHIGLGSKIKGDKFVMSKVFGVETKEDWLADHVYHVGALALSQEDWVKNPETGKLELNKNMTVTLDVDLEVPVLKTTLNHLVANGSKPMEIKLDLKFNSFEIHDVLMEINPISPEIDPIETPIELAEIDLGTDIVEKVEYIEFDKASPLTLNAKATLPEMFEGMDVILKSLQVEFPEGLVIDDTKSVGKYDAATRTLSYENVSLTKGLKNDEVVIERMFLPELVDNKLSYSGMIKVTAAAAAEGTLSSYNLLNKENGDVVVEVDVQCQPKISDYSVVISDYEYDVDFEKVEINESISKDIAELMLDEPILVSLKKDEEGNNPMIDIHLTYPNDPAIQIKGKQGEGLKIDLPDMLRFDQSTIKDSYNFNTADNTMTFTSEDNIPTDITLTLDNIAVQAEKIGGEEGKETYAVKDLMEVTGGVRLVGTTIHNADIERIKANKVKSISMNGNIPDIEPAEFGLNEYEKSIEESFAIDKIEVEVPEMIKSIDIQNLLLKDVYLDLKVDAASIKDVVGNVDMELILEVALPEMFLVDCKSEGVTYENNVLRISKSLDKDGKIIIDGVNIVGFDLSSLEINEGKLAIEIGEIPVKGTVKIKNLTVDLDKLSDKSLSVKIEGGLASRDDEGKVTESILIDKITGKVGMEIDPIDTNIDLSSVAETLNGEEMSLTLDINTFYLTLDLKTNIDIPLAGNLMVTPYFGNEPGESKNPQLALDPENRKDECYNIFISNINPNNPKPDSGYDGRYDVYKDYQFIELDLISMLYKNVDGQKPVMADSLKISVNAGVDKDKICTIEPNKDYKLIAEYSVGVPIEFGEKFAFEYRTKIDDLPEVASQVFEYGSVGLGGKVTNCLPLNLNLQVRPLDSDGNVIPLKEGVGVLKIGSCDAKGNPVTTKLDFVISGKGADLSDMKAIELIFTADAKGAAGAPLKPDGYLQVQLSARVPDGLTLDLGEFILSDDEQESEN